MTDTPAVPQIRSHGSGRTGSLANQYEVTPQAIRRDLNIMCNKKLPLRVPGGAVVSGDIYNYGSQAYANINILVEAYDAGGELIGEGFGFLVDACGTALLDYALPPEGLQAFSAPFELFEDGEAASVEVRLEAEACDYPPEPRARSPEARVIARADAAQLPVLGRVLAFLAERVELVEQGNERMGGRKLEHPPQVGRRLAEKRGNHSVRSDNGERAVELAGDDLRRQRLSAARRPAKEDPVDGAQAVSAQHVGATVFAKHCGHVGGIAVGQDDIFEPSRGIANREQGESPLAVLGDAGDEFLKGGRGGRIGAAVEDSLEVVGQQVMVFLPFRGDHLVGHMTEDIQVALGPRAK